MPHAKRRRGAHGRRALLWAAGAFLAAQLTAGALLDYAWPQVRFPELFAQLRRPDRFATRPTCVCLGSSRFGCLLDENEMTNVVRELTGDPQVQCFNGSIPAGDPIVAERLLRAMFQRGERPRYVLLEITPEAVNRRMAWMALHVGRQIRWGDLPRLGPDVVRSGQALRFVGTRLIPLYIYRDQVRRALADRAIAHCEGRRDDTPVTRASVKASRGTPMAGAEAKWRHAIAEGLANEPINPNLSTTVGIDLLRRDLRDYEASGTSARAFEAMIRRCRAHGAEPVLLAVPLTSAHRACYTPEIEASFQQYVRGLCAKYECRFVDYRTALPDHFFIDHHHGSKAGKRVFSRRLSVELLAPLCGSAKEATLAVGPSAER